MIRTITPDQIDQILFHADVDACEDAVKPEYSPSGPDAEPCLAITLPRTEDAFRIMVAATSVLGPFGALQLAKVARLDGGPVLYFTGVQLDAPRHATP